MSHTTVISDATPWRQDAWVMGLVGLVHASSHFSHLLLPLMFPAFIYDFGLSYAQLGLLMSVFFVVSGVGQAMAGFFVDHFGARPVLYASLAMLALASASVTQAQGYVGLLCSAVLFGFGNCTFHPVDFTILNNRVSENRLGYAFSAHGLTGNLGWAAAPTFMVGISALSHWRTAYACAALVFVVLLLLCLIQRTHLHTDPQPKQGKQVHSTSGSGSSLSFLRLPVVWWCFGFFVFSTMTLAVVQSFSVSILQSLFGGQLCFCHQYLDRLFGVRRPGDVGWRIHGCDLFSAHPARRVAEHAQCSFVAGRVCNGLARTCGQHAGVGGDGICRRGGRPIQGFDDQKSHPERGHWACVRDGLFGHGCRLCHCASHVWCIHGPRLVRCHLGGG